MTLLTIKSGRPKPSAREPATAKLTAAKLSRPLRRVLEYPICVPSAGRRISPGVKFRSPCRGDIR